MTSTIHNKNGDLKALVGEAGRLPHPQSQTDTAPSTQSNLNGD